MFKASSIDPLLVVSDEQAMWRVQGKDDDEAFAVLVRRWENPIRRLCERMTGDPHRAEDLAQETFAKVFSRRKEYRPDGKFSTWLWRIALNLCYDELRRRKRRTEEILDAHDDDGNAPGMTSDAAAPDRLMIDRERGDMIRAALDRLPEHYRTVLVLRHYEDLKFREIAEVLDVPEGTVKSRMAEALTLLNRQLQPILASEPKDHPKQTKEPSYEPSRP